MTDTLWASGVGLATRAADGTVLDTWFPSPALGRLADGDGASARASLESQTGADERRGVQLEVVEVEIEIGAAVASTPDAYLRLHLLSHLIVTPNSVSLENVFAHLPNNAWTTAGPVAPEFASQNLPALKRAGIQVYAQDKFPRLTDYVLPEGVRIGDASRIRLGAHLSPGTVVMHEGFVNFNAGTLGSSMVEGRISQGVVGRGGRECRHVRTFLRGYACSASLRVTPTPVRLRASMAPDTELRMNSTPFTPDSCDALTTWGAPSAVRGSSASTILVPAVT